MCFFSDAGGKIFFPPKLQRSINGDFFLSFHRRHLHGRIFMNNTYKFIITWPLVCFISKLGMLFIISGKS